MTATTPAHDPPRTADRPLRRDAERNRQRIIEAAREVFAERGLAATLNDVAHHAGVGVGTVYRRFPDKTDLVDAALADEMEGLADLIEEGLAAASAWDGLMHVLTDGIAAHVANRGLRDVALNIGSGRQLGDADTVRRSTELMERLLARARDEGSLRSDVTVTDFVMISLMITELADHSADVRPDAYRRYLRLVIDGLRAPAAVAELGEPLREPDADEIATHWVTADSHRRR